MLLYAGYKEAREDRWGSSDQIIHLEAATMLKMTLLLFFLLTQIFGTNGGSLPQQGKFK